MQNRTPHPYGEKADVCWWPPRFPNDPDHVKGFFAQFINDKWGNGHCLLDGAIRHASRTMQRRASEGLTCEHVIDLEANGLEYCPVCYHTEVLLVAREGLTFFQDFVRPLLREDTHDGVEKDQVAEIRHLRAKNYELQEELQVKKMQLVDMANKYVKLMDAQNITEDERVEQVRRHGQKQFDMVKEKFDLLAVAVEACFNVAKNTWNDHKIVTRALRREKARALEAMKAYRHVTSDGNQGPLVNVLTNLLVEFQQMYATVAPMAAFHNDLYNNDMVLVQKIDSDGLLERFCVDPDQKERMAFIRTEEYDNGSPQADPFIQVRGAFPSNPNDLEVGLKCLEIAPSSRTLGNFNSKVLGGVKEDIKGTGSSETARNAARRARKEVRDALETRPTSSPNLQLFTNSYVNKAGGSAPRTPGVQVVRGPPPVSGANAAPVGNVVKRYRREACGVAGLDPDRHANRDVLQLSVTPRPMAVGMEAAKAVEAVIQRVREGELTVGNRTGKADYAIFNEILELRGYGNDPFKPCEVAEAERERQRRVSQAQATANEEGELQEQQRQDPEQENEEEVIEIEAD